MRVLKLGVSALAIVAGFYPACAEVLPRGSTVDGAVVDRKSGEEVRFVEVDSWRGVEVNQDLLAGDTLRTNAIGSLAIRFADNTLVRMARETVLRVRKIDGASDSQLNLEGGTIWGRADRGGSGLTVDTPAAAAAIRGTDWTLRAEGDRTTLTVLEGTVELSNAQGTVTVGQGEGAVARIGEAPRKYILVNLKEREQVLLYSEVRGTFASLPVSGTESTKARAERRRILDTPEAGRSREDWLTLAETALAYDGRAAAEAALSRLPRPLPAALEARASLVEAMIAGQATRYDEAIRLFRKAMPHLSGERRTMARYGEWIALSLENPDTDAKAPSLNQTPGTAGEAIAQAIAIANLRGQVEAIEFLRRAEPRFPNEAALPAMRASLAYELDDRDEVRAALARARSIDPDDPAHLLVSARFRSTVSSDIDGALAELDRAVKAAPGDDAVWNEIGILKSDRNAIVEANAAHRRAIALNPENAALHANHARFLMDNDQMAAAKAAIDAAEALDPTSYAVLAAKGRYLLRMGRTAEGEKVLQEAAAVNPTAGDALIGLAIASYQSGADAETAQALDNADRFDRDNPSIALIRAGIAIDEFRADDAILNAREALRRRQARGGYYSGYDTNRQVSSVLGSTLDNLGLNEWSQYYKDRAFDPFIATSYDDEQRAGQLSPFVSVPPSGLSRYPSGSIYLPTNLQSLMLDPLAVASEERVNSLERRAFMETALTAGLSSESSKLGWNGEVNVKGTSYDAFPLSYNLQGQMVRPEGARENDTNDFEGGVFELGLRPTLVDNIYLFGSHSRYLTGYPGPLYSPTPENHSDGRSTMLGAAWSHTISDRNVVQAFGMFEHYNASDYFEDFDDVGPYSVEQTSRGDTKSFGLSHLFGLGPLTVRYGAEAVDYKSQGLQVRTDLITGEVFQRDAYASDGKAARLYADATYDFSTDLQVQAGAYYSRFDSASGVFDTVDPRVGIAWAPVENHWLRAYYRRDTQYPVTQTLSPVSTVGLVPLQLPSFYQGQARTAAVRWDAEWNERFFTALEYQNVRFDGVSIGIPGFFNWFETSEGQINRVSLAANYWVGNGLGLFGSFTWNGNRDTTPGIGGDTTLPLVPDYVGQVGFTYVHPSRVTLSVAQTFVGERLGGQFRDDAGNLYLPNLKPYSTTDAAVTWKSESGHLELALQLLNAFDTDIDTAFDTPAPGRTFLATMKARF